MAPLASAGSGHGGRQRPEDWGCWEPAALEELESAVDSAKASNTSLMEAAVAMWQQQQQRSSAGGSDGSGGNGCDDVIAATRVVVYAGGDNSALCREVDRNREKKLQITKSGSYVPRHGEYAVASSEPRCGLVCCQAASAAHSEPRTGP